MIHLAPEELATVRAILRARLPDCEARAFGSRATGVRLKPFSDLDLALMTKRALTDAQLGELREEFQQSDLPFRVDLVDWAAADADFRAAIADQLQPV
jgi:type I restriction enzyme S subunit